MKRWDVGLLYWSDKEPFEWVCVEAATETDALYKALRWLKPNHMQTLTVRECVEPAEGKG